MFSGKKKIFLKFSVSFTMSLLGATFCQHDTILNFENLWLLNLETTLFNTGYYMISFFTVWKLKASFYATPVFLLKFSLLYTKNVRFSRSRLLFVIHCLKELVWKTFTRRNNTFRVLLASISLYSSVYSWFGTQIGIFYQSL